MTTDPTSSRSHADSVTRLRHPVARASMSTMNDDGSRKWITPKLATGRTWKARRAVAWLLIVVFVSLPWITINGMPAVLLDLTTRRFSIFGHTFLATDTVLLALLGWIVFLSIFLITAVFGRVWCGWGCPQTVYMEFVFRPIERLCNGAPGRGKRGLLQTTALGNIVKWILFVIASVFIAHTFLSYFVGWSNLLMWVSRSPLNHPTPFLVMAAVSALMLFNFGFFREQTCLVACPYGRFQSVLLDKQSRVVAYDLQRGEPRSKASGHRQTVPLSILTPPDTVEPRVGDCVDCKLCVQVCPTGIDIRNGLQMECVNCAQCIDACDSVMNKLGRPERLIGYRSQATVEGLPSKLIRARVLLYPALLVIAIAAFITVFAMQAPSYIRMVRGVGVPYSVLPDGTISNTVKFNIINRRGAPQTYSFETTDGKSAIQINAPQVALLPGQDAHIPATLILPANEMRAGSYDAWVKIRDSGGFEKSVRYHMIGPAVQSKPPV
jgi:cytochrome c oxidase accessory protein FixG